MAFGARLFGFWGPGSKVGPNLIPKEDANFSLGPKYGPKLEAWAHFLAEAREWTPWQCRAQI